MTLAQFVVTITIALTTIAVALVVGAVLMAESERKQSRPNKRRVVYLCDGRRACGLLGCRDCKYTTDVNHAKNFAHEDGGHFEIEKK